MGLVSGIHPSSFIIHFLPFIGQFAKKPQKIRVYY